MKRNLVRVFVVSLMASLFVAGANIGSSDSVSVQASQETLGETITFLREKVTQYGQSRYRYKLSQKGECALVLEIYNVYLSEYTIPLSDLDPQKITASLGIVYLRTLHGKNSILERSTIERYTGEVVVENRQTFGISIRFNDDEIANRVANAFKTAAGLCGAGNDDGQFSKPASVIRPSEKSSSMQPQSATVNESKASPSGQIKNIWMDYDIYKDGKKGMQIHVKFEAHNLLNKDCIVAAYFYNKSGQVLADKNGVYNTYDGQVSVYERFSPKFDRSVYNDFKLFLPYDELHLSGGNFELMFQVKLYQKDINFFAESAYQNFDYSN